VKVFFVFVLFFSLSAMSGTEADFTSAPQHILITIGKATHNFTNSDGTLMSVGGKNFEKIMLEKLKEPQFRQQFVDETLEMHADIYEQFIKELKSGSAPLYSLPTNKKIRYEYSDSQSLNHMFEDLHLLKLAIASSGYISDSDERELFRKKIIRILKLSEIQVSEINRLKKENIEKILKSSGIKPADLSASVAQAMASSKITMTLLQAELADLPIYEGKTFQLETLSEGTPNYNQELEAAKKATMERSNLASLAVEQNLLPIEVIQHFNKIWISQAPLSKIMDFPAGSARHIFKDPKVINAFEALLFRMSKNTAEESYNFAIRASPDKSRQLPVIIEKTRKKILTLPLSCSKLFGY
jgi:hypothetical protein